MQEINDKKVNEKLDIYYDKTTNEYIPLAQIPKMWQAKIDIPFYGPDNGPRLGIPQSKKESENDDILMKIYIGSLGILGILILYKFYEKSL
jgi:hypothetical protein